MHNGQIEIPNKSSFKINEVCALTGVKSYVLRFWESEFPEISPLTSSAGVKLYEHRDIEAILTIKKLLFEDKLTIDKVKSILKLTTPKPQLVDEVFEENTEELIELDSSYTRSITKRTLIDSEFKKLILAKSKLVELVTRAEKIEHARNWN